MYLTCSYGWFHSLRLRNVCLVGNNNYYLLYNIDVFAFLYNMHIILCILHNIIEDKTILYLKNNLQTQILNRVQYV